MVVIAFEFTASPFSLAEIQSPLTDLSIEYSLPSTDCNHQDQPNLAANTEVQTSSNIFLIPLFYIAPSLHERLAHAALLTSIISLRPVTRLFTLPIVAEIPHLRLSNRAH